MSYKKFQILIGFFIFIIIIVGAFAAGLRNSKPVADPIEIVEPEKVTVKNSIIGKSVQGRDISVFQFGRETDIEKFHKENSKTGSDTQNPDTKHLLLVGGIHGGYEWNSVILAREFVKHFTSDSNQIPEGLIVSIIPSANPDGLFKVVETDGEFTVSEAIEKDPSDGTGRFNANNIDLNRNFDCKWQPESTWRGKTVSAGTEAFSEPESVAIRDYVNDFRPDAVVFLHSQANAVYASECNEGVLPETLAVMNEYSKASGYRAVESFDAYPVAGDAEGWLASIGIPAITVELKTHQTIEWEQNLAGVQALIDYLSS